MEKLSVKLENCYGISSMDHEFDFSEGKHVAIYASNGTMKSSLAKTFQDASQGIDSKEVVFNRTSIRVIEQDGKAVPQDGILVIRPPKEYEDMRTASSGILANEKLRAMYSAAVADLESAKDSVAKRLVTPSGLSRNGVESAVLRDFDKGDDSMEFFAVLDEFLDAPSDTEYLSGVKYDDVLNGKVEEALKNDLVRAKLTSYLQKYNELVSKSRYLSATFDHNSAGTVGQKLSGSGFFDAGHSINLNPKKGDRVEIKNAQEFQLLVSEEKRQIATELDADWDEVDRLMTKNKQLQTFCRIVRDNGRLLNALLNDQPKLRKNFWFRYLASIDDLQGVVASYKSRRDNIADIVKLANAEKGRWEEVVREFKGRFFVPFSVDVADVDKAVLEDKLPTLQFEFRDGGDKRTFTMDSLNGAPLSDGEARALYILNVLFKIKQRIREGKETIVVLDDIVDSFDYANKYAIIQYLKEISEEKFFYLIFLTHNFDFFRALMYRRIVSYENCHYARKAKDRIEIGKASNIKSLLQEIVDCGEERNKEKLIASIPFARNIVEYTKGKGQEYLTLTSLLHWRSDTPGIQIKDLRETLACILPQMKTRRRDGSRPVYDVIMETAKSCAAQQENTLHGKLALSVAIRMLAERFMWNHLGLDPDLEGDLNTHDLIMRCKRRGLPERDIETLDRVGISIPGIIHLNAFMYEPIVDIGSGHLQDLFQRVCELGSEP